MAGAGPMRFFHSRWFWIALVITVVGLTVIFFARGDEISYVTQTVKRESLTQSVDASGEVVSIEEVDLSFDFSGTIEQLVVRVGDAVGIGDLLAVLDSSELVADVKSAYQAVRVAQGNLDRERAGSSEETLSVSDRSVDVANAAYLASQIDADNASTLIGLTVDRYLADTDAKDAAVATAQSNLRQVKDENASDVTDAYDDLLGAAWGSIIEVRSSIAKADEVLGMRNGTLNDEYETNLSARDSAAKERAAVAFISAETSRDRAENAILSADYGYASSIFAAAQQVHSAVDDAAVLLLYVRQVVEATPTGNAFSASDSTSLLSSVDTVRASLQVDQAAIQNAFQGVQEAVRASAQNLEDAQNALVEAQRSFSATQKLSDYQVTNAKQSMSSAQALVGLRQAEKARAQAARDEVAAAPRNIDLASYESEVERARAAYESTQARLEKAQLHSPIAGNVTNVEVELGEQVLASESVITVQTTQEQFKIVADISESDISKISADDPVELTFDAFGSESRLFGTVGKIDPAEKVIESVVYYEVTVYLQQEQESLALRPGLSVDLVITTDTRKDALTIQQRAVATEGQRHYVQVLVNGKPERTEVTIGLRGDLGRVEILSGLNEGDGVIIRELNE